MLLKWNEKIKMPSIDPLEWEFGVFGDSEIEKKIKHQIEKLKKN